MYACKDYVNAACKSTIIQFVPNENDAQFDNFLFFLFQLAVH